MINLIVEHQTLNMDNQLIHLIIFLIVVKLLIVNCNPIEEIKSTEWKSSEKLDDIDDRQPTTINKSAINEDSTAKLKPRQYWLPGGKLT